MAVAEIHPSVAELEAFALGTLADGSLAAVEAHVAGCPVCQEGAAVAAGDTLVALLRRVHARTAPQTDTMTQATQAPTPTPVAAGAKSVTVGDTGPVTAGDDRSTDQVPPELAHHERYRVVRLLGQGGMGSVYEAEHCVMQRAVALKVINAAFTSRPATVERFRREVRAAARLSHPNIVTTYDAEDAGTTLFLVMEYVEGVSLAQLVKDRGPLPVAEACDYIRQAALGLQHAHERGMVHRDVKPHNLIRTPNGQVKVLDFGLATLTAERGGDLTEENAVMGTPDYMAPEQAEDARSADIRADVYSLGCTLFYLLTGEVPYPAQTTVAKIVAHREQPLPSIRQARPEVPAELGRVMARLLAKKPADRFATPAEVAAALAPFADAKSQPAKRGSKRGWLVAAAALFLLAAGIVIYRIQTDRGELVITTESNDVEVFVKQGGNLIEIMDGKTKKKITLRSGVYELELKDGKGLKLDIIKATLTRGTTVLAKIERLPKPSAVEPVPKPGPTPKGDPATPLTPAEPVVKEIQLLQRVRIPGRWNFASDAAVAQDGKFFAADVMEGNDRKTQEVVVWDGKTGKELYRVPGWMCRFTPDGKTLFVHRLDDNSYRLHDAATGKLLRSYTFETALDGCEMLPDSRHALMMTRGGIFNLCNLESGKILQSWLRAGNPRSWPCTVDGRFLFVWPSGEKNYIAWDVQKNQPSDDFAHIVKYDRIGSILPGNKQAVVGSPKVGHGGIVDVADGKFMYMPVADLPDVVAHGTALLEPRIALIAHKNGQLRRYKWTTDQVLAEFQLPDGEKLVRGIPISVSPDGRHACVETNKAVYLLRLIAAADDKKEPEKAVEVFRQRWAGHVNSSVDLSPDGRLVVAGYWDSTRLWDVSTGKPIRQLDGWIARFTPDGKRIVTADKCLHVYDAEDGKLIRKCTPSFTRGFWNLQLLSDGRRAETASPDKMSRLWDLETGASLHSWPVDKKPPPPAVDTDPTYSVTCRGPRKLELRAGGTIFAVDRASGKAVAQMSAGNFEPKNLTISRDGRFAAACAWNQECDLVVWRLPEPAAAK